MTDRLSEIEARLNAATPGPWTWDQMEVSEDYLQPIVLARRLAHGVSPSCSVIITESEEQAMILEPPDAALISHAPADIRWLVDEVKRLRALQANPTYVYSIPPMTDAEKDQLRERMKKGFGL